MRVLFTIYRLGEKSRVGEGEKLLRRVRGHAPPEMFWNEHTLRRNQVHFETQFREMLVCALTSSRLDDFSDIVTYVYCNDNNTFWGGWKLGILGGGELLPLKYPR